MCIRPIRSKSHGIFILFYFQNCFIFPVDLLHLRYPILGNHDYHVSVQAQIDRTYMHGEDLWTLPSNYYVYSYLLNDGGKMTIVYIDTQLLEPYHDDTQIIFDDPNWEEKRAEHLEWIDYTLEEEAKTATWLIVAGHYPIYSVGVNCDSVTLLKSLQPLLEKHKVHMYVHY